MLVDENNEKCNSKLLCIIGNCLWIETYLALWRKIEMNSEQGHLSYYPNLKKVILKALIDASIMILSKVYDEHKDSSADIKKVLNTMDSVKDFVVSKKIKEIKEFVKKQKEELEGEKISKLKENLKVWRDKFYAHTDKDYLNIIVKSEDDLGAEDKLRKEYPISVLDFEQLLIFAKNTAKHLYKLINGYDYDFKNEFKMYCELEIDLLFELLKEHRQNHLLLFDETQ